MTEEARGGGITTDAVLEPPRYRPCNSCGGAQAGFLFERNGYSIVECATCGLHYVGEDMAHIDFPALYSESYYHGGASAVFANYVAEETARRANARRKLWSIRLRGPRSGRLLDIGCAAGFFLAEARRYYDVRGVEISEYSSTIARERFGLDVFTGTLRDAALPEDAFDVITMWDVIEHLDDPKAELELVARALKPGGSVVVTTGDAGSRYARRAGVRWHLLEPPWHLYFFSRTTLANMAAAAGLRVRSCRSAGVASDLRALRSLPARVVTNLLGLGDIMEMTLTK